MYTGTIRYKEAQTRVRFKHMSGLFKHMVRFANKVISKESTKSVVNAYSLSRQRINFFSNDGEILVTLTLAVKNEGVWVYKASSTANLPDYIINPPTWMYVGDYIFKEEFKELDKELILTKRKPRFTS